MIDIRIFRNQPELVRRSLKERGLEMDLEGLLELDRKLREITRNWEETQHRMKALSQEIGLRMRKGEDVFSLKEEVRRLGETLDALEAQRQELEETFAPSSSRYPTFPTIRSPMAGARKTIWK
jgi:Seryl-tRNA synthetase